MIRQLINRLRRQRPGVTTVLSVTNGVTHMLISDPVYAAEMERGQRAWWDGMTPEQQADHLRWEQEQTNQWLAWAASRHQEKMQS